MNFKKYIKFFGHVFSIVALFFIFNILKDNLDKVQQIHFTTHNYLLLIAIVFWGLIGYFLFAYTWLLQLKQKYPRFSYILSLKIIATTQISKYLPGNIGHLIGRFYLAKAHLRKRDIAYTLFIENILFVLSSCLVGSFYFIFYDITQLIKLNNLLLVITVIVAAIALVYFFLIYIKNNIDLLSVELRTIISLLLLFSLISLTGGISVYFIFKIISNDTNLTLLLCISSFSLSFLLGFIIPGAPGGIGIREYSFTVLMSPFVDTIYAVQAIIIFRFVSILTDLIFYLIGKKIKYEP